MAFLTKEELKTNLHLEIINVITRADDGIVDTCIADAVFLAKGYLSRYDLEALFGTETLAPTILDSYLKRVIKSIAVWYLIELSNPNCRVEMYRTAYSDAIEWLGKVQSAKIDPEGWLQRADDPTTERVEGELISFNSNPKQNHHF